MCYTVSALDALEGKNLTVHGLLLRKIVNKGPIDSRHCCGVLFLAHLGSLSIVFSHNLSYMGFVLEPPIELLSLFSCVIN